MAYRIGIIGVGAIGSVVGGMLTKAGHDVTLIDQWPEHVEAMKKVGLRLSGTCGEHLIPVRALLIHELQSVAEPFDAGMYEPGHAIRTDRGQVGFKIGEHDGKVTERAERLAKIMCDVAPAKVTTNLWGERWSKLSVNCMANGLAGLSGLGSAEVRTRDGVRRVAIHLAAEAITVGRARGHEVEPIWGIEAQRFVDASDGKDLAAVERDMAERAKELAGARPSLLQDVMRGRRTEVQYLNGYVSEQGKQVGIPTPFNDRIVELITRVPPGTLKPDPKNLEPLV